MLCNRGSLKLASLTKRAACLSIFAVISGVSSWAQAPQVQGAPGQYPPGQYPPNRPTPVAVQCQSALADRISADARRRVSLSLDTQSQYSPGVGRQGLRGRLRYGIGGPNTWRTATYDCVVNLPQNRVERATYTPRANNIGWPGGPGPGVGNYPRVRVDTSGRGNFNGSFAANVKITRGFVDTTGRPSVSLRGGNFQITLYGVVDRTDGNRSFSMRITGSDRGAAQGRADVRLNGDRNEVEMINLNGRIGRSNFTGNFNRD
jgi:hypothetical protein